MSLEQQITEDIKSAMINKEQKKLMVLRSLKTSFQLEKTKSGSITKLDDITCIKIIQKLLKQRKESASIYQKQDRIDLSNEELEQARFLEKYLPQPLSKKELEHLVEQAIQEVGAQSTKDMGKLMGILSEKTAGKADNKDLANLIKQKLS